MRHPAQQHKFQLPADVKRLVCPPAPFVSNSDRMDRSLTLTSLPAVFQQQAAPDASPDLFFGTNHSHEYLQLDLDPPDVDDQHSPSSSSSSTTTTESAEEVDFWGSNHTRDFLLDVGRQEDLFGQQQPSAATSSSSCGGAIAQ